MHASGVAFSRQHDRDRRSARADGAPRGGQPPHPSAARAFTSSTSLAPTDPRSPRLRSMVILEPLAGCHYFELEQSHVPRPDTRAARCAPRCDRRSALAVTLAKLVHRIGVGTLSGRRAVQRPLRRPPLRQACLRASWAVLTNRDDSTGNRPLPSAVRRLGLYIDLERSTMHLLADGPPRSRLARCCCSPSIASCSSQTVPAPSSSRGWRRRRIAVPWATRATEQSRCLPSM